MEQMKTDNELIAEFSLESRERASSIHDGKEYLFNGWWYNTSELEFHTSWDWLMPVVEKIGSIDDFDMNIYLYPDKRGCTIFGMSECPPYINIGFDQDKENQTLLQKVYKAVVEFIRWYNNTQKP